MEDKHKEELRKNLEKLYGEGNVEIEDNTIDFNNELKKYKQTRRLINFIIYILGFASATIIFFLISIF